MKVFFTWFLVFGIIAGLGSRVLALDFTRSVVCVHEVDSCGHSHEDPASDHHHHGNDCPADHHHHGCCVPMLMLALTDETEFKSGILSSSLMRHRHESERAPDAPFLASEKPPLI